MIVAVVVSKLAVGIYTHILVCITITNSASPVDLNMYACLRLSVVLLLTCHETGLKIRPCSEHKSGKAQSKSTSLVTRFVQVQRVFMLYKRDVLRTYSYIVVVLH